MVHIRGKKTIPSGKRYTRYKHHMEMFDLATVLNLIHFDGFTPKGKYASDIITFDIETTTLDKEHNWMYIWMICVNGKTFYHWDWSMFKSFINYLAVCSDKKVVIWVHNLAYEFGFIQDFFEWDKVFATSPHKTIYCTYKQVTFRCSYIMSGLGLAKLSKAFKLPVKKLVGDLDYSKCRLPGITELTEREMCYCENDVLILYHYIKYMIDNYHDFAPSKMPYTSTGFTRLHMRNKAAEDKQYGALRSIVKESSVTDIVVYNMFQRAFAGGYAHANYAYNKYHFTPEDNNGVDPIRSRDKKSFYPSIMVKEKFPRKFFKAKKSQVLSLIKKGYAVIMDVSFLPLTDDKGEIIKKGIEAKTTMTTISEHKCAYLKNAAVDNGRVFSADKLVTTITELDYDTISQYYNIGKMQIGRCYAAKKRYLPKVIVDCVLDLYEAKTVLKDVKGVEQEYQRLKALLNSLYGMCVTDILMPLIVYNTDLHEWNPIKRPKGEEAECMLLDYKTNYTSLLLYQTGIYITAYARHEILEENWVLGQHRVVYNDTDSTKYLWDDETERYFEERNHEMRERVKEALEYHKIPEERMRPKDIKGREHILGEMGDEGTYTHFKTLGAKRYIYIQDGHLSCTIAGLPKKAASDYLLSGQLLDKRTRLTSNKIGAPTVNDIFDKFCDQMVVPSDVAGKNTHYYTRPSDPVLVTDYQGHSAYVKCGYGISLVPQSFEMSLAAKYRSFLTSHQTIEGFSHCERLQDSKEMSKIKTFWEDFDL